VEDNLPFNVLFITNVSFETAIPISEHDLFYCLTFFDNKPSRDTNTIGYNSSYCDILSVNANRAIME